MTLAERRIVNDFQTNQFPGFEKRVEEAVGFAVPIEVQWETLALPGESHLYAECWPKIYFEPLIEGLTAVCRDEMGREAIKGSLKKIVIQNVKGVAYGDRWATYENGVLTLDHEPTTNAGDTADRRNGLVAVLESSL